MPWTRLEQALPTHPKTLRLAELLGFPDTDLAWAKIARLWLWALDYCPNGRLTVGERPVTDKQIALAANFHGDATVFVRSLIDAGFIDIVRGGLGGRSLQIHDWQEYGGRYHRILEYDRERNGRRKSDGIPTELHADSRLEERRREEKRKEEEGEGTPPPKGAAPRGTAEEVEILKTIHQFAAWAHPALEKKREGVLEMVGLGLPHDYIRSAAQVNRPADAGFWDIVKALKAGHSSGRNGRGVKLPSDPRTNGQAAKPERLREPLDDVHRRRDEALKRCDEALKTIDEATLATWTAEAEAAVARQKLPAALKKSAIDVEIRLRVARKIGVTI